PLLQRQAAHASCSYVTGNKPLPIQTSSDEDPLAAGEQPVDLPPSHARGERLLARDQAELTTNVVRDHGFLAMQSGERGKGEMGPPWRWSSLHASLRGRAGRPQ